MFKICVSGGCIISKRFSVYRDERFLAIIKILREADVAFTHLEGTICEYDGTEVYPAAEAGWTWIRAPLYFAEELKWAGIDLVSHASNHSLDYMYGGLYSTWKVLKDAGLPFAGTGRSLSEARRPAYLDTAKGRVALISASSSTTDWARACDARGDDRGRPGVNQLRTHYQVDEQTMKTIKTLAVKMGRWLTEVDDECTLSPAGLHNTVTRFIQSNEPGVTLVADRTDVEGNLRAIREAKLRADFVMFHLHNHEWDITKDLSVPPPFVRSFARSCIDAGSDLFIAEGSHALLRGIEIYRGKPIFYDPGDIFKDGNAKTRPLSEYYWMTGLNTNTGKWEVTTVESDNLSNKRKLPLASNPPGGYNTGKVLGVIIPVCTFGEDGRLQEIKIYPATHLKEPQMLKGLPGLESGDMAKKIIDYVGGLSAPFGTKIDFRDGIGVIKPAEELQGHAVPTPCQPAGH